MKKRAKSTTATASDVEFDAVISAAWEGVGTSFKRNCVMAGVASLQETPSEDAERLAGATMSALRIGRAIAGEVPPERLAPTAARSRRNVRGYSPR